MKIQDILMLIEIGIIGITALLTWYIYQRNKNDDLKSRALMIYYQIKSIEENINYIKINCYKNNSVLSSEFYKSSLLFSVNLWDENKIYLSSKLNIEAYNAIEKFYIIAANLLSEQIVVKMAFSNLIATKQRVYYETQLNLNIKTVIDGRDNKLSNQDIISNVNNNKMNIDEAINLAIDDYIPNISNDIVRKCISEYKTLTDGNAYNQLRKISGINN